MMNQKFMLLAVVTLGASIRFHGLGAKALWSDEARTWRMLQFPVGEMVARSGGAGTVHPPLYFLLLGLWTHVLGDSEFALRSLSAVSGVITIVLMTFLMSELGKFPRPSAVLGRPGLWDATALVAAALVAVNPFQIHMSRQARPYGLGAALFVGSSWALLRVLRAETKRGPLWALYGFFALASCFNHHLALISVAAQWIFALVYLTCRHATVRRSNQSGGPRGGAVSRRPLGLFSALVLGAAIALAVAYALWLPKAINQTSADSRLSWRGQPRWDSVPRETYIALFSTFANRLPVDQLPTRPVLAALAVALILLAWRVGWSGRYVATLGIVPALMIIGYSRFTGIDLYYSRYLIYLELMWLAAIATLVGSIPLRAARLTAVVLIFAVSAYCCYKSWDVIGPSANPGMRGAVDELLTRRFPGEPVAVLNHEGLFLEALYYARGQARPLLAAPLEYQKEMKISAHLEDKDFIDINNFFNKGSLGAWVISRQGDRLQSDLAPGRAELWRLQWQKAFRQDYRWEGTVSVEYYRSD